MPRRRLRRGHSRPFPLPSPSPPHAGDRHPPDMFDVLGTRSATQPAHPRAGPLMALCLMTKAATLGAQRFDVPYGTRNEATSPSRGWYATAGKHGIEHNCLLDHHDGNVTHASTHTTFAKLRTDALLCYHDGTHTDTAPTVLLANHWDHCSSGHAGTLGCTARVGHDNWDGYGYVYGATGYVHTGVHDSWYGYCNGGGCSAYIASNGGPGMLGTPAHTAHTHFRASTLPHKEEGSHAHSVDGQFTGRIVYTRMRYGYDGDDGGYSYCNGTATSAYIASNGGSRANGPLAHKAHPPVRALSRTDKEARTHTRPTEGHDHGTVRPAITGGSH